MLSSSWKVNLKCRKLLLFFFFFFGAKDPFSSFPLFIFGLFVSFSSTFFFLFSADGHLLLFYFLFF